MRTLPCIVGTFGLILASAHAAPPWQYSQVDIDSSSALVVSVTGSVTADTDTGKQQPLATGSDPKIALSGAGATLRTGPDGGATLILPAAGIARVGPNTEVRLPSLPAGHVTVPATPTTEQPIPGKNQTPTQPAESYDKPSQSGQQHLELIKGDLFLKIDPEDVKKRGPSTFLLKTPCSLLAVKGTEFFASTNGMTDTTGVHEGAIEVYEPSSDKTLYLKSGSAVEVKPGAIGNIRRLTMEERRLQSNYTVTKIKRITLEARWDTALPPEDTNADSSTTATNFSVKNPHGTVHTLGLRAALPGKPVISVRDLLVDTRQVQGRPLAIEILIKGGHVLHEGVRTGNPMSMPSYGNGLTVNCGLSYTPRAELHQATPRLLTMQGTYEIVRASTGHTCRYVQLFSNPQFSLDGSPLGGTARLRFSVARVADVAAELAKVEATLKGFQPPIKGVSEMGRYVSSNARNGIEITGVSMLVLAE